MLLMDSQMHSDDGNLIFSLACLHLRDMNACHAWSDYVKMLKDEAYAWISYHTVTREEAQQLIHPLIFTTPSLSTISVMMSLMKQSDV